MFAIFLHENMNAFHQIVTSFPTAIFTVLLIICMLYWIIAVLGMVDLDVLDLDYDGDIDTADSTSAQEGIAGLLLKFGLGGVPLTIVLTFISIFGWLFCYYGTYLLIPLIPTAALKIVASIGLLLISIYAAVMLTSLVIRPIRKLFSKLDIDETKHIIGQTVSVRSAIVNADRGEALLSVDGVDLLLNVRSMGDTEFKKNDQVVVIEKINENNLYRVIAKSEFDGV